MADEEGTSLPVVGCHLTSHTAINLNRQNLVNTSEIKRAFVQVSKVCHQIGFHVNKNQLTHIYL